MEIEEILAFTGLYLGLALLVFMFILEVSN